MKYMWTFSCSSSSPSWFALSQRYTHYAVHNINWIRISGWKIHYHRHNHIFLCWGKFHLLCIFSLVASFSRNFHNMHDCFFFVVEIYHSDFDVCTCLWECICVGAHLQVKWISFSYNWINFKPNERNRNEIWQKPFVGERECVRVFVRYTAEYGALFVG